MKEVDQGEKMEEARPFLKWPGGKRWAIPTLLPLIRRNLKGTYYEPFLGGGAMFFATLPDQAVLSDINTELISTYQQVKDNSTTIVRQLKRKQVTEFNYYRVRGLEPESPTASAVRLIYLLHTCFGGLYRVNQSGQFNVPFSGGERRFRSLFDNRVIEKASNALQNATLVACDFQEQLDRSTAGDVVYCDPTYTVAHDNNGFSRYNEKNFSWADQERLAKAAFAAARRGALVIVSNAHHKSIRELYSPCRPRILRRMSRICPDAGYRRDVKEYLFIIR